MDAPFPPSPFRDGAPFGHTQCVGSGGMERCATPLLARCPPASEQRLSSRATVCAGVSLLADAPFPPSPFQDGAPLGHTQCVGSGGVDGCATPLQARCQLASERRLVACNGPTVVCRRFLRALPPRATLDVTAVGAEVYGTLLSSAQQLSACPLLEFYAFWRERCVLPTWLDSTLRWGDPIQFKHRPPPFMGLVETKLLDPIASMALSAGVSRLLERGAVTVVPPPRSIRALRRYMRENDWFTSLDLKDAYFHVPYSQGSHDISLLRLH